MITINSKKKMPKKMKGVEDMLVDLMILIQNAKNQYYTSNHTLF